MYFIVYLKEEIDYLNKFYSPKEYLNNQFFKMYVSLSDARDTMFILSALVFFIVFLKDKYCNENENSICLNHYVVNMYQFKAISVGYCFFEFLSFAAMYFDINEDNLGFRL
jgi:hypothetical protein